MAAWPVHPAADRQPAVGHIWQAAMLLLGGLLLMASATADERPMMSDYDDPQAFVADMLAWRSADTQEQAAPDASTAPPLPLSEGMKPWHRVTGPEDLEQAVKNAHGYEQPRYQEPRRYERTTHISFPLAPLPADHMARQALPSDPAVASDVKYSAVSIPERVLIPEETDPTHGASSRLEIRTPEPRPVQVQLR